jgi:hypothetical protein
MATTRFTLPSSKYEVVDQEGEVILSAPLMELYYTICLATEEATSAKLPLKQGYIMAANEVNAVYGCTLDWGQIIEILNDLNDQMESLKKNTTSTPELLTSTS